MTSSQLSELELRRLSRDIDEELKLLDEIRNELARTPPVAEGGPYVHAYVAVKLHDYYTCLEILLERIVRVVEGALPAGPNWHRDLLRGVARPLPDIRPAILSPESERLLMELLSFRHFFRHSYAVPLDPGHLEEHTGHVEEAHSLVTADLASFKEVIGNWIATLQHDPGSGAG